MTIDPYALCPAGTGKKLKFCCPDLIGELDKVERLSSAQQNQGCLAQLEQMEKAHPGRACVLSQKALLHMRLKQLDQAHQTIDTFLAQHPRNPVALGLSSLILTKPEELPQAVSQIQLALEVSEDQLPMIIVDALTLIGELLLVRGHPLAGQAHLTAAAETYPDKERAAEILVAFHQSGRVPLLLREDLPWADCPADAPWTADYHASIELAATGRWRAAYSKLSALAEQVATAPVLWRSVGYCLAFLAEEVPAAEAFRRIVALGAPLDDAVEAEAMAQIMLGESSADAVDVVRWEYKVTDFDRVQTLLLSDKRALVMRIDTQEWIENQQIPPLATWQWLDRPRLSSQEGVTLDVVPSAQGEVSLFGKQTDRDAVLSLVALRTPGHEPSRAALLQLLGDNLRPDPTETVLAQIPAEVECLSPRLMLPPEMPVDQSQALLGKAISHLVQHVWPEIPSRRFGGRSARAAAGDSPIQVLAAILILETNDRFASMGIDFNALRQSLGLPVPAPIDPAAADPGGMPLCRLPRIDLKTMTDDQLMVTYVRAVDAWSKPLIHSTALEMLARPVVAEKAGKANLHLTLSKVAPTTESTLQQIELGRRAVGANDLMSQAQWDLEELPIRLLRQEAADIQRLLGRLTTKYNHIPEIRQQVAQLLMELGIIDQHGRPIGGSAPAAAAPAPPPEPASKLWTPGSPAPGPTAAPAANKPALWTPGMD